MTVEGLDIWHPEQARTCNDNVEYNCYYCQNDLRSVPRSALIISRRLYRIGGFIGESNIWRFV